MGNKLAYVLIAVGFLALIVLNPGQEQHRRAFMDYAHAHFFELPKGYQDIYKQLRTRDSPERLNESLRYGNFILFSTLSYTTLKRIPDGGLRPYRRPLTVGAFGFVWPITMERAPEEHSAIDQ